MPVAMFSNVLRTDALAADAAGTFSRCASTLSAPIDQILPGTYRHRPDRLQTRTARQNGSRASGISMRQTWMSSAYVASTIVTESSSDPASRSVWSGCVLKVTHCAASVRPT
jgi:hypothetical protein